MSDWRSQNLPQDILAEKFLEGLKELIRLRNAYSSMGGMTISQAKAISSPLFQAAEKEFNQRHTEIVDAADDPYAYEVVDKIEALRKKIDHETNAKINKAIVLPFRERLDKFDIENSETGITSANFVMHCPGTYGIAFDQWFRNESTIRGNKELLHKIATHRVNPKKPY